MRSIIIILLVYLTLVGCSNGKIDYRKTKNGCIVFNSSDDYAKDSLKEHKEEPNTVRILSEEEKIFEDKQKESSEAYLVNTSKSHIISFTVKFLRRILRMSHKQ
ncbi:MAG: hypothetical protein SGJ10_11830 [Bacteroidota bacterium]|nr:hypothetical protein [Bacteroidota bacterium]